nr:reverse transcriptase domain-containing protein [Tanacetum cinerariifolium]
MMSNQIRPPGFPPVPNNQNVQLNQRNNQNRFIQNLNHGNNFNQGPVYQSPVFQPPAYQAPAPQTQGVSKEDFSAYAKANDAVMRNMKTQEATKETLNPTHNRSTEDVQPQVVQSESPILNSEPVTSPISEPIITPVMQKFSVTYRLATPYHPQTSGQVEVSNRGLKRILERAVGENHASWSDKLDDALWAFRTAYKTPIGCTPYKLVYEKACHLPIELEHKAYWSLKHVNFGMKIAGDHRKVQLNELHDQAYKNSLIYKEKTKRLHDSKIKDRVFNIGDRVLIFNSRLKIFSGKLKSRWSGPFTISQVYPYGTVELSQPDGPNFKVNNHRLKYYFGEDVPKLVVPDL